jgi:predicted phosphodiesterase
VFPFGKVVGELLLAGINSVAPYSGIKNPIGSNGRVDDTQLKGLESLLASSLFRMHRKVVLIHHHFSRPEGIATGAVHTIWESIERQTMKLRGKKRLLQIFKKGRVELVLHGHLHRNEVYERGAIRMQNAGGSVMGQREMGQCYILQVFPDGIESRLHRVPAGEVAKVSSPVFQPLMPSVHVAA